MPSQRVPTSTAPSASPKDASVLTDMKALLRETGVIDDSALAAAGFGSEARRRRRQSDRSVVAARHVAVALSSIEAACGAVGFDAGAPAASPPYVFARYEAPCETVFVTVGAARLVRWCFADTATPGSNNHSPARGAGHDPFHVSPARHRVAPAAGPDDVTPPRRGTTALRGLDSPGSSAAASPVRLQDSGGVRDGATLAAQGIFAAVDAALWWGARRTTQEPRSEAMLTVRRVHVTIDMAASANDDGDHLRALAQLLVRYEPVFASALGASSGLVGALIGIETAGVGYAAAQASMLVAAASSVTVEIANGATSSPAVSNFTALTLCRQMATLLAPAESASDGTLPAVSATERRVGADAYRAFAADYVVYAQEQQRALLLSMERKLRLESEAGWRAELDGVLVAYAAMIAGLRAREAAERELELEAARRQRMVSSTEAAAPATGNTSRRGGGGRTPVVAMSALQEELAAILQRDERRARAVLQSQICPGAAASGLHGFMLWHISDRTKLARLEDATRRGLHRKFAGGAAVGNLTQQELVDRLALTSALQRRHAAAVTDVCLAAHEAIQHMLLQRTASAVRHFESLHSFARRGLAARAALQQAFYDRRAAAFDRSTAIENGDRVRRVAFAIMRKTLALVTTDEPCARAKTLRDESRAHKRLQLAVSLSLDLPRQEVAARRALFHRASAVVKRAVDRWDVQKDWRLTVEGVRREEARVRAELRISAAEEQQRDDIARRAAYVCLSRDDGASTMIPIAYAGQRMAVGQRCLRSRCALVNEMSAEASAVFDAARAALQLRGDEDAARSALRGNADMACAAATAATRCRFDSERSVCLAAESMARTALVTERESEHVAQLDRHLLLVAELRQRHGLRDTEETAAYEALRAEAATACVIAVELTLRRFASERTDLLKTHSDAAGATANDEADARNWYCAYGRFFVEWDTATAAVVASEGGSRRVLEEASGAAAQLATAATLRRFGAERRSIEDDGEPVARATASAAADIERRGIDACSTLQLRSYHERLALVRAEQRCFDSEVSESFGRGSIAALREASLMAGSGIHAAQRQEHDARQAQLVDAEHAGRRALAAASAADLAGALGAMQARFHVERSAIEVSEAADRKSAIETAEARERVRLRELDAAWAAYFAEAIGIGTAAADAFALVARRQVEEEAAARSRTTDRHARERDAVEEAEANRRLPLHDAGVRETERLVVVHGIGSDEIRAREHLLQADASAFSAIRAARDTDLASALASVAVRHDVERGAVEDDQTSARQRILSVAEFQRQRFIDLLALHVEHCAGRRRLMEEMRRAEVESAELRSRSTIGVGHDGGLRDLARAWATEGSAVAQFASRGMLAGHLALSDVLNASASALRTAIAERRRALVDEARARDAFATRGRAERSFISEITAKGDALLQRESELRSDLAADEERVREGTRRQCKAAVANIGAKSTLDHDEGAERRAVEGAEVSAWSDLTDSATNSAQRASLRALAVVEDCGRQEVVTESNGSMVRLRAAYNAFRGFAMQAVEDTRAVMDGEVAGRAAVERDADDIRSSMRELMRSTMSVLAGHTQARLHLQAEESEQRTSLLVAEATEYETLECTGATALTTLSQQEAIDDAEHEARKAIFAATSRAFATIRALAGHLLDRVTLINGEQAKRHGLADAELSIRSRIVAAAASDRLRCDLRLLEQHEAGYRHAISTQALMISDELRSRVAIGAIEASARAATVADAHRDRTQTSHSEAVRRLVDEEAARRDIAVTSAFAEGADLKRMGARAIRHVDSLLAHVVQMCLISKPEFFGRTAIDQDAMARHQLLLHAAAIETHELDERYTLVVWCKTEMLRLAGPLMLEREKLRQRQRLCDASATEHDAMLVVSATEAVQGSAMPFSPAVPFTSVVATSGTANEAFGEPLSPDVVPRSTTLQPSALRGATPRSRSATPTSFGGDISDSEFGESPRATGRLRDDDAGAPSHRRGRRPSLRTITVTATTVTSTSDVDEARTDDSHPVDGDDDDGGSDTSIVDHDAPRVGSGRARTLEPTEANSRDAPATARRGMWSSSDDDDDDVRDGMVPWQRPAEESNNSGAEQEEADEANLLSPMTNATTTMNATAGPPPSLGGTLHPPPRLPGDSTTSNANSGGSASGRWTVQATGKFGGLATAGSQPPHLTSDPAGPQVPTALAGRRGAALRSLHRRGASHDEAQTRSLGGSGSGSATGLPPMSPRTRSRSVADALSPLEGSSPRQSFGSPPHGFPFQQQQNSPGTSGSMRPAVAGSAFGSDDDLVALLGAGPAIASGSPQQPQQFRHQRQTSVDSITGELAFAQTGMGHLSASSNPVAGPGTGGWADFPVAAEDHQDHDGIPGSSAFELPPTPDYDRHITDSAVDRLLNATPSGMTPVSRSVSPGAGGGGGTQQAAGGFLGAGHHRRVGTQDWAPHHTAYAASRGGTPATMHGAGISTPLSPAGGRRFHAPGPGSFGSTLSSGSPVAPPRGGVHGARGETWRELALTRSSATVRAPKALSRTTAAGDDAEAASLRNPVLDPDQLQRVRDAEARWRDELSYMQLDGASAANSRAVTPATPSMQRPPGMPMAYQHHRRNSVAAAAAVHHQRFQSSNDDAFSFSVAGGSGIPVAPPAAVVEPAGSPAHRMSSDSILTLDVTGVNGSPVALFAGGGGGGGGGGNAFEGSVSLGQHPVPAARRGTVAPHDLRIALPAPFVTGEAAAAGGGGGCHVDDQAGGSLSMEHSVASSAPAAHDRPLSGQSNPAMAHSPPLSPCYATGGAEPPIN